MFSNKFDGDNSFNLLSDNRKLYKFYENMETSSVSYEMVARLEWAKEINGLVQDIQLIDQGFGLIWSTDDKFVGYLTLFEYDPATLETSVKESKTFKTAKDYEDNYQFILPKQGLGRILFVDEDKEL